MIKTNPSKRINLSFWGNDDLISLKSYEKKEDLNSVDIMALRYAAGELFSNPANDYITLSRAKIERSAAISDNALYLGDFAGYRIGTDEAGNELTAACLEMSTDSRVILSVFTPALDSFCEYLVY